MARITSRFIVFGNNFDQVNAQLLPANYTPVNYTPVQVGTEGTNKTSAHLKGIDGSFLPKAGGTMTGAITVISGTVTAPSIAVTGSASTGLYSPAANQLAVTSNGVQTALFSTISVATTVPILTPNGSAAAPSRSFSADLASGMYLIATSTLGFSTSGVEALRIWPGGQLMVNGGTYSGVQTGARLVVQTSGTDSGVSVGYFGSTSSPNFTGFAARGTIAAPTATQSGDLICDIRGRGQYDSTVGHVTGVAAQIKLLASENFSATANGTSIQFLTTLNTTTANLEALRIENTGYVGINASSLGTALSHRLSLFASGATGDLTARFTYVGIADPGQPALIFTRARGTISSPTAAQSGDVLASISARPANTTSIVQANLAPDAVQINFVADENFSLTAGGSHIEFLTTTLTTQTLAERMRLTSLGQMQLACGVTTTATNSIGVSGTYTVLNTDLFLAVTTSAAVSINLPAPSQRRVLFIKDISGLAETNNITLVRNASESIEGLASNKLLQTNWGSWILWSDGTNWYLWT